MLLRTGGRGLVADLFDIYLDEMPGRLDQLREAVENEDVETVRTVAHKIKGSSSNLGLPEGASAGATLEDVGMNQKMEHKSLY